MPYADRSIEPALGPVEGTGRGSHCEGIDAKRANLGMGSTDRGGGLAASASRVPAITDW